MSKIRVGVTVVALLGTALALTVWFSIMWVLVLGINALIN